MASSRDSSTILRTILPFEDFVWILQKEEYDAVRYARWLPRFFFRRRFARSERLVRTKRALATLILAVFLWLLAATLAAAYSDSFLTEAVVFAVLLLAIPLVVGASGFLLAPVFAAAHFFVRSKAAGILAARDDLTVVAVAGSYGKTTTKNFIHDLVRFHHRTQLVSGNINTPAGIAAWVRAKLVLSTKLLIVEADSYKKSEMEATARMLRPHIVVVTNVGDQHLERFGSVERLEESLRALPAHARKDAVIVADETTMSRVSKGGRRERVADASALRYRSQSIDAAHLSASNRMNLALALAVADLLDIPEEFVVDAVPRLTLPDRRQKPASIRGYEGIDDSYNISLSTARAGLSAARSFANARSKKLLVVAAGIPELGPRDTDGNVRLGEELGRVADHIAVLSTVFARDIRKGIANEGKTSSYADPEHFFEEAPERFPSNEWVLLLEPALPDLYY